MAVGRNVAQGDFGGLGDDGFIIKTEKNGLSIAGENPRGTLFGVYSFLESLGCRWWDVFGVETIPSLPTISIAASAVSEKYQLIELGTWEPKDGEFIFIDNKTDTPIFFDGIYLEEVRG